MQNHHRENTILFPTSAASSNGKNAKSAPTHWLGCFFELTSHIFLTVLHGKTSFQTIQMLMETINEPLDFDQVCSSPNDCNKRELLPIMVGAFLVYVKYMFVLDNF